MYETELLEMVGDYEADDELEDLEFDLEVPEDWEMDFYDLEDLEYGLEFEDWEFEDLEGMEDYELMQEYAAEAAEAESEAEADMFIGPVLRVVPMLIRRIAPRLLRYAPLILRAARALYRYLSQSPRRRSLLRYLPTILQRTIAILARLRVRITFNVVLRVMLRVTRSVRTQPAYGYPRRPYGYPRRAYGYGRRPRRAPGYRYGPRPGMGRIRGRPRRVVRPRYCVL